VHKVWKIMVSRAGPTIGLFLLFLLGLSVAAPAQQPQQSGEVPEFLKPPPIELLRRGLQPLSADLPDTDVREGLLPPDASQGLFSQRGTTLSRGDQWMPIGFCWQASGIRYRPTYFEDTMLERHGHKRHWLVQPAVSGARFFGSIAALPYGMTVDPPWRPMSNLGHFRAGSGTPYMLQRPPLQVDAGMLEAGLIVGLIFIVP
jgi:hypothetical protein